MNAAALVLIFVIFMDYVDCWWIPGVVCRDPATGGHHHNGDVWRAPDGCNACMCFIWQIRCTHIQCTGSRGCHYTPTNTFYQHMQRFKAVDGCNHCTCINGNSLCTKIYCRSQGNDGCLYRPRNTSYRHGQGFASVDGCNTCKCSNGEIVCTQKSCHPVCKCFDVPTQRCVSPGQAYNDGCNLCSCRSNGISICTTRWCEHAPQ